MPRSLPRYLLTLCLASAVVGGLTSPAPAAQRPADDTLTATMDDITAVFEQGASSPQYANIENDNDGCGWTAGWIGFCTATGDMLNLVQQYNSAEPGNVLQQYTPTLQQLAASGSDDTSALGDSFPGDWKTAAGDPQFVALQLKVGHDLYLTPAKAVAAQEGVQTNLGLENLFDTALMMGPGQNDCDGVYTIAKETDAQLGGNPAGGVDEHQWLTTYNQIRQQHMKNPCTPGRQNDWPQAVDRSQALQQLADQGNFNLDTPLTVGADFNITISDPHD